MIREDQQYLLKCFADTMRSLLSTEFLLLAVVRAIDLDDICLREHFIGVVIAETPIPSDGSESDYFSWHEFGQLPAGLLDQVSQGKELAVTGTKGERVVVDLGGAAEAVSKSKACFSKP
ncbi:hypothetical protein HLI18_32725 [Rhizobium laguerreae]|uniref:hypothetical protein n=1 Tax=Rhizobium laguerreae TaxID=1076926 RepID=UPI0014787087|nr:hypothetical protein [Rhizobium laguerreae]NNG74532.1 hypothetical protein [Rhizobium laguerreae]